MSTIVEANPLMAGVIMRPALAILIKLAATLAVVALFLRIEYRTRFSSLPIATAANAFMVCVVTNNLFLIAQAYRGWAPLLGH